jgi:hypothetical protein
MTLDALQRGPQGRIRWCSRWCSRRQRNRAFVVLGWCGRRWLQKAEEAESERAEATAQWQHGGKQTTELDLLQRGAHSRRHIVTEEQGGAMGSWPAMHEHPHAGNGSGSGRTEEQGGAMGPWSAMHEHQ